MPMKRLLLFLLLIPTLAKAQTPITPSFSRVNTQTGIRDSIRITYSGQITPQWWWSSAQIRYWILQQSHVWYGDQTINGNVLFPNLNNGIIFANSTITNGVNGIRFNTNERNGFQFYYFDSPIIDFASTGHSADIPYAKFYVPISAPKGFNPDFYPGSYDVAVRLNSGAGPDEGLISTIPLNTFAQTSAVYNKTQVDSADNRKQDTSKTEHFLGQIFAKNSFSSLTGFTDISSGVTVSGSVLNFATGSGDNTFVKQLQVTYTTALKKYREIARFVVGEKSSTSYGFALGTQSTYSGPGKINIAGKFDMTNTASSGQVSIVGGDITNLYPTLVTGSTALTFSVGDTVEMVMERYMNKFTVSARNISTSSAYVSATTTMTYNGSAGVYQPNMGQFAIYNLGGAFKVSALTINSREIRNPKLMMLTDSKGEFGTRFLTTNVATYLTIMNNSTVLLSGRGNTTTDMLALLPEVLRINPETADLSYSSNDIRGSVSPSIYEANYKQMVDSLTAHGIKVIHTLPLYEPALDQTAMASYIKTNYPTTYVNVPIVSSDLVDGTHLNEAGMLKWYNSTSDAVKIQQGVKNEVFKFILDQSNTLLTGLSGGQTVYGGFNSGDNITLSSTFNSTKGKIYLGTAQTTQFDEVNSWFGIKTIPTHSLTLASTGNGIAHYNTVDQTTNLERGTLSWSSNAYGILVANAGTGTQRDAFIRLNSGRQFNVHASPTTAGTFEFAAGTSGTGPVAEVTGTYTAATGRQWGYTVGNTINQSSTAGFTSFGSYPLVSGSGSGGNFILQGGTSTAAALGGTLITNYSLDNAGNSIQAGSSKSSTQIFTNVAPGAAGTDSLLTKNPTTNVVGKISAAYYLPFGATDNIISKTANYTVVSSDFAVGKKTTLDIYVDATAGNVTITLPTYTSFLGYTIYVTKTDASANTVTINTVVGNNTLVSQYQVRQFNTAPSIGWVNH